MKQPSSEEEPKLDSNEQGEKEDFVNQGKIPLGLVANCTVVLCAVVCCCSHTVCYELCLTDRCGPLNKCQSLKG